MVTGERWQGTEGAAIETIHIGSQALMGLVLCCVLVDRISSSLTGPGGRCLVFRIVDGITKGLPYWMRLCVNDAEPKADENTNRAHWRPRSTHKYM